MKQCLIVIDMQNAVFALKRPLYRKEKLIENVGKAIRLARERGIQIIFSLHENDTFLKKGTDGHRLVEPLAVSQDDLVVNKPRPDIFDGSNLEETLREMGVTSLIVTGVISNGCVKTACLSALKKGFDVTLVKDAHSTCYANAEKIIGRVNRDMESTGAHVIPVDEL
ncbi:MAG: cysteine hydrolase [Clostridiales bacterium]|nr:cysteine hydrolase [Clostridiales bacterium]